MGFVTSIYFAAQKFESLPSFSPAVIVFHTFEAFWGEIYRSGEDAGINIKYTQMQNSGCAQLRFDEWMITI